MSNNILQHPVDFVQLVFTPRTLTPDNTDMVYICRAFDHHFQRKIITDSKLKKAMSLLTLQVLQLYSHNKYASSLRFILATVALYCPDTSMIQYYIYFQDLSIFYICFLDLLL